ncbi:glutamine amidotransferase-related protein, partial [Ellagibacter isourolithinifaciens]
VGGNAVLKQSSLRCGTARGTSPDSAALLDGGQAEPELSSLRSENAGGAFPDSTPQPGSDLAFACPLFNGIAPGEYFYFTHSFIAPTGSHTIAETTHSTRFTSAVQYGDRAFGVQFHPEKSSDAGARVLANFVAIVARG